MRPEPSIFEHLRMFLVGLGAAGGGGVARFIIVGINTGTDPTKAVQGGLMFILQPIAIGFIIGGLGLMMVSLTRTALDYYRYWQYFRDQ